MRRRRCRFQGTGPARNATHAIRCTPHHCSYLQLNEIERSLDAAEADPARFKLSQADLAERRKWALASQRQTSSLQTSIASARAASEAGPKLTASSKLAAAVHDENDRFIHSESQRQQQLLRCGKAGGGMKVA